MIAAVYARKSTAEQNGADADAKSVSRQIESARAFAAARGWSVDESHVYADDAVSGAETHKLVNRQRLLDTIRAGAPFQVVVMRDTSRFSRRDGDEAFAELKAIDRAGVQVWFYQDGQRFKHGTFGDNIVGYVKAEAAADYRRQIAAWTRAAMEQKARKGFVTGGRCFGYENVRVDGHVERRINETEAAVVREIFDLYLAGHGVRSIAELLNQRRAPCPRAQQGRASGWSATSVSDLLKRAIYHGEIVWNQTKKRDAWGQKHQTARPESEWTRVPAPELRIVDEDVCLAVQARRAAARRSYLSATGGERFGRPANGRESKYLLTGLTRCASCGHSMIVRSRSHRSHRAFFYRCGGFHSKGSAVCSNNVHLPLEAADDAILAEIEKYVLHPRVVTRAVELAVDQLTPPTGRVEAERKCLMTERSRVERQIENIVSFVKQGKRFASLVTELSTLEGRRAALDTELAALARVHELRFDRRQLERDLLKKLDNWRGLLRSQVQEARPILRLLLPERITFEPAEIDGVRGCRYSGVFRLGALFDGVINGQERGRPQRDSNPCLSLERAIS